MLSPIRDLRVHHGEAAPGRIFLKAVHFWRSYWPAFAIPALVPLAALVIHVAIGVPSSTRSQSPAPRLIRAGERHVQVMSMVAPTDAANGGDLQLAVTRLEARLAVNPRDADGWRLLAKSYEYLGRTADAVEANRRAMAAAEYAETPQPANVASRSETSASFSAAGADLAARAEQHRRQRDFHTANELFAELAKRGEMNADLWADYADAIGGERGALDAQAAKLIDNALRLEPGHAKALWLLATWQTQRRDYTGALVTWQRLATELPADSPDARLVAANIEEARALLRSSQGG